MAKSYGGIRVSSSDIASHVRQMCNDILSVGHSRMQPFSLGSVEGRIKAFSQRQNIEVGDDLYMSNDKVSHAIRDEKREKGIAVSVDDLVSFAINRRRMNLYYDSITKNFTYTDGKNKFIVAPLKRVKINRKSFQVAYFISAQKLNRNETFEGNRRFIKL